MLIAPKKQEGFVLIVALILLVAISLLVVNGMGLTTVGEKMSGNQMDRTRAQMAAEQALTQGIAALRANADTCLNDGCTSTNPAGGGGLGFDSANSTVTLRSAWPSTNPDTSGASMTLATGQATSARYLITWQSNATFTPAGSTKVECKAYSVMGRGKGLSSNSVVVLQTIAYVCPST